MHKEAREELDVKFKLIVLDLAEQFGVTKTCRDFKVPRSSFYRWKKKFGGMEVSEAKRFVREKAHCTYPSPQDTSRNC